MTEDICQCPKCGRMHRLLGKPPWINRSRMILVRIRAAVRRMEDSKLLTDVDELANILDERIAD